MHPIDPHLTLPEQLKALRLGAGKTLVDLADRTGLSRLTVSAAEGKADTRVSTVVALFNELGYVLIPVPKPLLNETVAFINQGGRTLSLPAGTSAPLGPMQRLFEAKRLQASDDEEHVGRTSKDGG
jgi:transcriptional regulator with XRE-family HTH domain